ncbi:ABC transporter substrate-binding protein [Spirochaetota bacterium]
MKRILHGIPSVLVYTIIAFGTAFSTLYPKEKGSYPKCIISLGPALTEKVFLLGAGERLAANTTYCMRPVEAQKKEKIGTVIKANIEKIISLKPDLILATSLTSPKEIKKLKKLGIRVMIFPQERSFSEICSRFIKLGEIIGEGEKAHAIVSDAKKEVEDITQSVRGLKKKRIFFQIGAKPLFAVSRASFMNDYITLSGGVNIVGGGTSGLYSREKVISQGPDIIIITAMGIACDEEMRIWEKYITVPAVKNEELHIVDSYTFCSSNPVTFIKALREMVRIVHPHMRNDRGMSE